MNQSKKKMKKHSEEEIKKYLLALSSFGDILYPKADGRVEIPQKIVKNLGWDGLSKLYICGAYGILRIVPNKNEDDVIGSVKVSGGRIRIPASIIKKSGLNYQKIKASIYEDKLLLRADIDISEYLKNKRLFLVEEKVESTSELFHNKEKDVKIKFPTGYEFDAQKETCLILPDESLYCLSFRVLGPPFKFQGYWIKSSRLMTSYGESNELTEDFYLIPGMSRKQRKIVLGYLLVTSELFNYISRVLNVMKHNDDNPKYRHVFEKDFMIIKTRGDYQLFINPTEEPDRYQGYELAQFIENYNKFLHVNFSSIDMPDEELVVKAPKVITTEHIPVIHNNSFKM